MGIKSKDSEVGLLHKEIERLRADYEKLVEIKQALTLEISIYKQIIEGEEKRIRKVSKKMSSGLRRMSSAKAEDSSNSSSSESDQDANRTFKEVDEIDGKKFTSKRSVNYYSRSSKSNYN